MKRLITSFLQTLEKGLTLANQPIVRALWHLRHPTLRGVAWACAASPVLLVLYVLILIPFTPSIGDIRKAKIEQPAQILSADGKLLAEFKPSNREWVKLKDISPNVVNALIATEDHRFYQHFGLDWRRTASAALHTFSGDRQGGSTITQQLARNLYPDEIGRAPTLTRKIKEAITAFKIEALYTKDEILETYLNTVPFLYNAYGIEMAARTYFDKSAGDLNVLESATLTGMLKGNSYYNPVLNPERALQRRNTVLAQMVKYGKLTPAAYATLSRRPLRIDFERQTEPPGPAPHFAQQLRKWLAAWADRNDYNIYSDGLVVRTTIDSRLQTMATQAVTLQGNQLQGIANSAWGTRAGCANGRDLLQTFLRETPDYRAAKDAGLTDDDAMKRVSSDRDLVKSCASPRPACRRTSSPWTRATARSRRGSAAATSARTRSTTSSRRGVSRVRPSSRSSTPRPSKTAPNPAIRLSTSPSKSRWPAAKSGVRATRTSRASARSACATASLIPATGSPPS